MYLFAVKKVTSQSKRYFLEQAEHIFHKIKIIKKLTNPARKAFKASKKYPIHAFKS